MDGDFEDLPVLCALAARTGSLLIIDEAHTFGIAGPQGSRMRLDLDVRTT